MAKLKKSMINHRKLDKFEIDASADVYPMLSDEEYKHLLEDIKKNGQRQPVLIYKNKIMDGRNRFKAIKELKKSLSAIVLDSYEDALKLASSNNDKRRHMSKSQFAMKTAQEIVDKIVSKRSVESAIKLAKKDEQLAQAVFEGEIELSNALRKLQDKQEAAAIHQG